MNTESREHIICKRENPLYTSQKAKWEKVLNAYSGGEEYIEETLIQHSAECTLEFNERIKRCHYFNYPKRVLNTIISYVLGQAPKRSNVNEAIEEDFDKFGNRTNEVMRKINMYLDMFGLCWVLVDNPNVPQTITLEQKINNNIRPYSVVLNPLNVTDWNFGADGKLDWVIIKDVRVEASNPGVPAKSVNTFTLWTRTTWERFIEGEEYISESKGTHNIGEVPIMKVSDIGGYGLSTNHWFNDAVSVSDSILNAESEAQINTIKQIFGLAVFPDTFIERASKSSEKLIEQGATELDAFAITLARSTAVTETADEKGICRYIAPPAYVVSVIRDEIKELKKELYDVFGLGIKSEVKNAQSAEAKAWDFVSIGNAMKSRADLLEQVENAIWKFMNKWDSTISIPSVTYNRDFELRQLKENIQGLLDLKTINNSEEFTREIKATSVSLLDDIKKLPQDKYNLLIKEALTSVEVDQNTINNAPATVKN